MRTCRCVTKQKHKKSKKIVSFHWTLSFLSSGRRVGTNQQRKEEKKKNYQSRNLRVIARFHNRLPFHQHFREVVEDRSTSTYFLRTISVPRFRIVSTFYRASQKSREQGRMARKQTKQHVGETSQDRIAIDKRRIYCWKDVSVTSRKYLRRKVLTKKGSGQEEGPKVK